MTARKKRIINYYFSENELQVIRKITKAAKPVLKRKENAKKKAKF